MSSDETSSDEQSMELFSFRYDKIWTQNRLSEMRQDGFFQNREPGTFSLYDNDFNEDQLKVFLELFSYFHERGIIWKELIIGVSTYNERFTRPLLHAVNTMKICKTMSLESHAEHGGDSDVYSDLCPGFASNTSIQELSITTTGCPSRGDFVALNNLLQTNAPCLQTLVIRAPGESYRWILPGLRDNRTLKTINFDFDWERNATDTTLSAIVAALGTNPSLESLKMHLNSIQIGDLTSENFKTLLTNSTSLRELQLYDGRKLNAECIIQGLKNSRSLKRLTVENFLYGDLIFARFFRILPDCPLIEEIWLRDAGNDNPFFSEEDLVQVKLLPRLPRPIKFHLNTRWIPFKRLVELLRCHPEVRIPYYFVNPRSGDDATRTELRHIVRMNWHGRYLLDRPNVPLSLWPLVLEKVNDNLYLKDEERASILYELLQGPAGFGRTSF